MSDKKLDALAATSIFSTCSKKHLELIGQVTDQVSVSSGTDLIKQSTVPTDMYILISGTASVDIDGKSVATVGEGDVVGELSMVDGGKASATVTMSADGEAWVVGRRGFIPVWEKNPDMSRALLDAVVARLRATDELLH